MMMTDQVSEYNVNNTVLLENTFSVKEEDCQSDDFVDAKFDISDTAIIIDNPELQGNSLLDQMKEHDLSCTLDIVKTELLSSNVEYDMKYDNLKIEEEISPKNIKTEISNGLLYCEDCHVYCEDYCIKCGMLVHILNRSVQINAHNTSQEELPNILQIQNYFEESHVSALKVIPVGIRFGPFTGLNRSEHPWKIKGGKFVVDDDKSKCLNWMQYINPARNISEQNLLVFQYGNNLYYQSTRQIHEADELLVYFGEGYEDSLNRNIEMDFIPTIEYIFKDVFACTFCCLGFSSKLYLIKHKTICPTNAAGGFSIEELTQCPSCKIYLDQNEYFMHHMAHCSERSNRKCILSTKACAEGKDDCEPSTDDYMNAHIKSEHLCPPDEMEQFKCSLCEFESKYKTSLKRHMDARHAAEFNYKCATCDYQTNFKSNLKTHIEGKHLKEFKYKCDSCDYKTNFKSALKKHIKGKHLKEFKYKCDRCEYRANCNSDLKKHIEGKHLREFKYKCDVCEYKANFKSAIKKHVEGKHLKEFKYKCDACDYTSNWKSHLKTHTEAKHLKEFKYKCDICEYKANQKSHLEVHIETKHLQEFKHKCDTCDYKTNNKSNLKTHIETRHLKEFKHKCDLCDYKANCKFDLKRHIGARHLTEHKHKCDRCDYKTNNKPNLRRHVEARHLKT